MAEIREYELDSSEGCHLEVHAMYSSKSVKAWRFDQLVLAWLRLVLMPPLFFEGKVNPCLTETRFDANSGLSYSCWHPFASTAAAAVVLVASSLHCCPLLCLVKGGRVGIFWRKRLRSGGSWLGSWGRRASPVADQVSGCWCMSMMAVTTGILFVEVFVIGDLSSVSIDHGAR